MSDASLSDRIDQGHASAWWDSLGPCDRDALLPGLRHCEAAGMTVCEAETALREHHNRWAPSRVPRVP